MKLPFMRFAVNPSSAAIFAFSLFLLSAVSHAGIVRPAVTDGDWMNDDSWLWRSDHQSTDGLPQVPQSGDTVFLAHPEGTIIKLSELAPKLHTLTVGNSNDTSPLSRLVLAPGARLETNTLVVGRPGGSTPNNGGLLEIETDAACIVTFNAIIGGRKENLPVSNGFLLLRGGEFTARTLYAGHGGKGSGSLISIKGQRSQLTVSHNAEIRGVNTEQKASGATLEFLVDADGVAPLLVSGDLDLQDLPVLRVDLAGYAKGKVPSKICLIKVEGVRNGDFAKPEFLHLPKGIQASVHWTSDNSLMLELTR